MRDKNIFVKLPVEEPSDSEKHDSSPENTIDIRKRRFAKARRNGEKNRTSETAIEEFSALTISNMSEKSTNDRKEAASVARKKVTGANNWKTFLENAAKTAPREEGSEKNELILNVSPDVEKPRKTNYCVAIDCEMVGVGDDGKENMLARVSIVNSLGECLYDTFVKPTAAITDYRTPVSGVRPCDLVHAEKFSVVQKKVLELIRDKILVGHAVYNDLIVLRIKHPRQDIRDTTRFKKFYSIGAGTPSLKKLTAHFLNVDIQCGEHSSVQDAQAAMQLYMLYRKEWEADLKKRRHLAHHHHHHHTKKKPKTSYKPKRFGKNYKK